MQANYGRMVCAPMYYLTFSAETFEHDDGAGILHDWRSYGIAAPLRKRKGAAAELRLPAQVNDGSQFEVGQ